MEDDVFATFSALRTASRLNQEQQATPATWRERLRDRATVLSRDDAVARGWFGPLDPFVRPRVGDVVVDAGHREGPALATGR